MSHEHQRTFQGFRQISGSCAWLPLPTRGCRDAYGHSVHIRRGPRLVSGGHRNVHTVFRQLFANMLKAEVG